MHPMLFIDFAMWINPSFKYDVLKFVYDQMIEYRKSCGDAYKEMTNAVSKIVRKGFLRVAIIKVAKAVNFCVFNSHEPMIRNQYGEEKKMRELFDFQRKVADLINDGFLKSYDETIAYLRKKWNEKYVPKALTQ